MWLQKPGIVNDHLVLLGTRENNIYLLKGDVDMLVGGGCQWIVRELMQQIQTWKIDMQRVKYLFVGHSHFDHCGALAYLKHQFPQMAVLKQQSWSSSSGKRTSVNGASSPTASPRSFVKNWVSTALSSWSRHTPCRAHPLANCPAPEHGGIT